MVIGAVMIFVWKYAVKPLGGAFGIYELLPAFLVALAVNIIVSLLTTPPEKEVGQEYEAYALEMRK